MTYKEFSTHPRGVRRALRLAKTYEYIMAGLTNEEAIYEKLLNAGMYSQKTYKKDALHSVRTYITAVNTIRDKEVANPIPINVVVNSSIPPNIAYVVDAVKQLHLFILGTSSPSDAERNSAKTKTET